MRISTAVPKFCGNAPVWTAAKMLPARPAIPAPKLNAMIFSRLTGMPISSAASGSSREDFQARPVLDSLRKWSTIRSSTTTPSRNQKYPRVVWILMWPPKKVSGSTFAIPFEPFVIP